MNRRPHRESWSWIRARNESPTSVGDCSSSDTIVGLDAHQLLPECAALLRYVFPVSSLSRWRPVATQGSTEISQARLPRVHSSWRAGRIPSLLSESRRQSAEQCQTGSPGFSTLIPHSAALTRCNTSPELTLSSTRTYRLSSVVLNKRVNGCSDLGLLICS